MSHRPKKLQGDEPRVPINAKARAQIKIAVQRIAGEDERTFSNAVERLLEESPRVKRKLKELQAA